VGCKRHVWALPPSHKRQPIDLELNKIDVPQSGAQPSAPRPRALSAHAGGYVLPATQPPTRRPSESTHTSLRTLTMAGAKMYRVVIAWIERSSFSRRKVLLGSCKSRKTNDPQPEWERARPTQHSPRVLAQWEGRTTLSAPRFSLTAGWYKSCRRKIKRNALLADSLYFEIDTCVSEQKMRSCLRHFFFIISLLGNASEIYSLEWKMRLSTGESTAKYFVSGCIDHFSWSMFALRVLAKTSHFTAENTFSNLHFWFN
jgi:hypothetical protein